MHQKISLLCFAFLIFSTGSIAKEKFIIAVGEYPPLVSQHFLHYGVTARIIREAFALEGIDVEYKFTNWARAFRLVIEGEADGIGPILKTNKRENQYYFSDSLYYETQVFFHKKNYLFNWNTIDDLSQVSIGATISYSYGEEFDQAAKSKELMIQRVPTDEQNFKKMFADRIKIFPQSLDVGYYILHSTFPDKVSLVTHHVKPVNQNHNYLAFSKAKNNSLSLIKHFNRGLQKLKESGKYELYFTESRNGNYIIKSDPE